MKNERTMTTHTSMEGLWKKGWRTLLIAFMTVCVLALPPLYGDDGTNVSTEPEEARTEDVSDVDEGQPVQIAILDVISTTYQDAKRRILTDILRTEVFKLNLFQIIERGVIERIIDEHELSLKGLTRDRDILRIGQFLSVEKLFVCTVDEFSGTIAINIRIIDVNTSLVDYTENIFVKDEALLFDAMKDAVKQIEVFYVVKDERQGGGAKDTREFVRQKWQLLGATEKQIAYLTRIGAQPEEFLEVRQYDIKFDIDAYVTAHEKGWDVSAIKRFFQSGISYLQVQKAFAFGIYSLDTYKQTFRPHGFSFDEYLDAYANHIVTAEEYREYKRGYEKDKFIAGVGGVASEYPIMTTDFKYVVGVVGWEHYVTEYQRNTFKASWEMGGYLLNFFAPVPYLQANFYFGRYPFYGKVAVGGLAELLLGGHFAGYLRVGMEIGERFEFSAMVAWGTPNTISYTDFETHRGEAGFVELEYPYMGAFFTTKW